MYQLTYEPWGLAETCVYGEKPVTAYDLDANEGGFAEHLSYFAGLFKFLCLVLVLITFTEVFLIYVGKIQRPCKLKLRTLDKIIVARRLTCLIIGKIGFVIVSYMSSYAESDKFKQISQANVCTP